MRIEESIKLVILERYPDFKLSEKSFTYHDGAAGKRKSPALLPKWIEEFIQQNAFSHGWTQETIGDTKKTIDNIVDLLELDNMEASTEITLLDVDDQEQLDESRDEYQLVIDRTQSTLGVVEVGSNVLSTMGVDTYKNLFTFKEWNLIRPLAAQHNFLYYTGSDMPVMGEYLTMTGPKPIKNCNMYMPPRWQFEEDTHAKLHKDHRKVIEMRFADVESLERYYCVLYHMLTSRNRNICGLVSDKQGTGKSTVMGEIPSRLVGLENFSVTDKKVVTANHKDIFIRRRCIFFDEHTVTPKQYPDIKKLVERMLHIDPKGKTAINVPNTASLFMASNNFSDIYTEPGDRRNYFLEDSERYMKEELGQDWLNEYFIRLEESHEFVANLGYWILNTFKDYKYLPDAVHRGPTFEKIVRDTANETYRDIITTLQDPQNSSEPTYSGAKKRHNRDLRPGNTGAQFNSCGHFKTFFRDFRWEGEPICTVKAIGEGEAKLIPINNQ